MHSGAYHMAGAGNKNHREVGHSARPIFGRTVARGVSQWFNLHDAQGAFVVQCRGSHVRTTFCVAATDHVCVPVANHTVLRDNTTNTFGRTRGPLGTSQTKNCLYKWLFSGVPKNYYTRVVNRPAQAIYYTRVVNCMCAAFV